MANIMEMKSIRNKPSRNGFDLSFKRNFTAKTGELLPIMCKEVIPGDKFTILFSPVSIIPDVTVGSISVLSILRRCDLIATLTIVS